MFFAFLIGPALIMLPDSYWEKLYLLVIRLIPKRTKPADQLLTFIVEKRKPGALTSSCELPTYKFYNELLVQTLDQARRFGSETGPLLTEIRTQLIEDQKFERKMRGEVQGAIAQFLMVGMITWGFILSTYLMVDLAPSTFIVTTLIMMQLGGAFIFRKLYRTNKHLSFFPFESYFKALISFKGLFLVGIPVQQALSKSGISDALSGPLTTINERLSCAIKLWKGEGLPISSEIEEALSELHFLLSERYRSFLKKVSLYKFMVLALFYLPSYLIYIFHLMNRFFTA